MSLFYKLFILVICQIVFCNEIAGQNFHFSNQHENLFINNPACITRTNKLSFLLTYRNQWPGNSDFVTYDASLFYTSDDLHSTAGISFLRDVQGEGIINANLYSVLYGFKTKITRDWEFSGGIQAAYTTYTTNFSDLTFEGGQVPGITLNERTTGYDFSSGIEFIYNEDISYGFSVSKIGSLLPSQSMYQGLQFNLSYIGSYMLKRGYGGQASMIEPLFFSSFQRNFNEILWGARIENYPLAGGLYLRQNLRFQYDAIIILLGTRFGKMALFYTYDINLSGADSRFTKLSAHEVTFLYDMQYKRKSSKKGAIKCPKI